MSDRRAISEEMWLRIGRLMDGEGSSADCQAIEDAFCDSPELQKTFLAYYQLHIDLSISAYADSAIRSIVDAVGELRDSPKEVVGEERSSLPTALQNIHGQPEEYGGGTSRGSTPWTPLLTWTPLCLVFFMGVLCTVLWYRFTSDANVEKTRSAAVSADGHGQGGLFVARLVSNTGDVWNASAGERLESGDRLRTKETLTIQEGTAKLELVSGLTLHLEGPAMVSVDAEGMPVLQYGKVVASLPWGAVNTDIKTSLGTVQLDEDDVAGVSAFGSNVDVYVFRGDVLIQSKDVDVQPLLLNSGEGKTLRTGPAGKQNFYSSRQKMLFGSWNSITSERLSVTDSYVESVRESRPVAYWRFEDIVDDRVLNEVSDRHHATIGGKARLAPQGDNHALEFGFGPKSGYLIVEDPFDELAGNDYAFELWIKPNHFHRGTVVGLVDRRTPMQEDERTALLLETVDERTYLFGNHRPYSLRFLHRSPPGSNLNKGKSCYSSQDYEPGKWQHVVAVKQGPQMRLYVDGKVLGSNKDQTALVSGLNLVVGQLYSFESVRPYVGQIDELAVYDHALTSKEIHSRYDMLH